MSSVNNRSHGSASLFDPDISPPDILISLSEDVRGSLMRSKPYNINNV
jgi:hypothetical protein